MFDDLKDRVVIRRHSHIANVTLTIQEMDKVFEVIDHFLSSIENYRAKLASDERTEHFAEELTEILEHACFISTRPIGQKVESEHNGNNY